MAVLYRRLICLISFILVLAVGSAAQAGPHKWEEAISAANPLHWYRFDETTGTACFDYGSEGLNGTYDGVFLAQQGFFGATTAVRFDRSAANAVNFAGGSDLSGPWTAEYIVKKMSEAGALDSQCLHDSASYGIRLAGHTQQADAGFVWYRVADYQFTPVGGLTQTDLVVPIAEWMHITFRRDDTGRTQLFFNGELVGTSMNSFLFPRERIGIRDIGTDMLDAFLDEAVVYDYALTDAHIFAHATAALFPDSAAMARNPRPTNGETNVPLDVVLSWMPGDYVTGLSPRHKVFFSDAFDDVNDGLAVVATHDSNYYPVTGTLSLNFSKTYYWRVDEANSTTGWDRGDVWNFTTLPEFPPAIVPTPLSVGIDDVGWKRGWSSADTGGPWRGGMAVGRWMVWEDYEVLVYVAKTVKTRLQCLFVMGEFDRANICAEYPTTTQEGSSWDNSALVSDDDFVIMNYIKDNAAYIEFGLHGVGHEHWEDGVRTRAEFANGSSPWPWLDVWGHMECFQRLIDQYGISFPRSFVAPAHCYYYNPSDPQDTGALMHLWGVKYADHPATYVTDNGLMVLARIFHVGWSTPSIAPGTIASGYYYEGSHWTNYVETDPANNHIAGDKWIVWFNQIKDSSDRYLPKNTAQLFSQYLYQHYANIIIAGNTVEIDNTGMPDWAYDLDLLGSLLLKLPLETGTHVSSANLDGGNIACYYEDRGFGYIILPELDKSNYTLTYLIGTSEMPNYVLNDGTYNVNKFETWTDIARISLQMYGTQDVKVKLNVFDPWDVHSSTTSLIINSSQWDDPNNTLVMNITATDVQGIEGDIIIISDPIGDLSGDSRVDFVDFAILASQWLQPPGSPSADVAPVPDGDDIVDILDLDVLAEDWLQDNKP